jgi:hypothetical protein
MKIEVTTTAVHYRIDGALGEKFYVEANYDSEFKQWHAGVRLYSSGATANEALAKLVEEAQKLVEAAS